MFRWALAKFDPWNPHRGRRGQFLQVVLYIQPMEHTHSPHAYTAHTRAHKISKQKNSEKLLIIIVTVLYVQYICIL